MKNSLPVLLLKNLILLPNQEVKLELTNPLSKNVVFLAGENYNNELMILSLKNQMEEIPDVSDLPTIGVVAKIKSKLELPNGNLRVTLRGLFRAKEESFSNHKTQKDTLECMYQKLTIPSFDEMEALAVKRKVEELLQEYCQSDGVSNSILNVVKDVKDLNKYTDYVASFLSLPFAKKLEYVEEMNPVVRGHNLIRDLHLELQVIDLEKKLDEKLQQGLEESQKEFILKEKLREIEEELGDTYSKREEVRSYEEKLESLQIPSLKVVQKIKEEIQKFERMSDASPEIASVRNYLDWILNLPWSYSTTDECDLEKIEKNLDKNHFGMEKAKEKVLEYIAARNRNPDITSPILCLVGPPGVGKTTFAKSIADSLNKEFYKISVGGLNDSAILNGYRRTYLGSSPGKIIEGLKRCGCKNPVFLIDEVDKMVKDYKGDPASTLLDILDKTQNNAFVDNYIEEEFDLSQVFFILTANYKEEIPYELYNRLEIVELSSYTVLEKIMIAKKYLLPRIYKEHKISNRNIKFMDAALKEIIMHYTYEAGVRDLEKVLTSLVRKCIIKNKLENCKITPELVLELLGPSNHPNSIAFDMNPGMVNGLAVGLNGGVVSPIESCFYDGNGKIEMTGSLSKVMEESIKVSMSYLWSHQKELGFDGEVFQQKNGHIHLLEAAVKKDGPSAGIAITTSILSLIKNKSIAKTIAMTGEITLQGNVKKIGSLKEKIVGAYNEGIKKVYIPKENHNDLVEIPKEIVEKIQIVEVSNYQEIYQELFS